MVNLRFQKKMAADVLKVGITKVWFDPEHIKEIREAITKADIRRLIKKGYIDTKEDFLRWTWKERNKGKVRKGGKYAVVSRKERWVTRIRALRRLLRELRDKEYITNESYRRLYRLAKGGMFRSRAHLLKYAKDNDMLLREYKLKK
ncbi:MAG: 50S ribosomal protein L19e [Candidatus Aenigmarchaeota archaeon]|nr:50S ribosomal protein L19e [Candidatus Aenigmarchaeota archaeon]